MEGREKQKGFWGRFFKKTPVESQVKQEDRESEERAKTAETKMRKALGDWKTSQNSVDAAQRIFIASGNLSDSEIVEIETTDAAYKKFQEENPNFQGLVTESSPEGEKHYFRIDSPGRIKKRPLNSRIELGFTDPNEHRDPNKPVPNQDWFVIYKWSTGQSASEARASSLKVHIPDIAGIRVYSNPQAS